MSSKRPAHSQASYDAAARVAESAMPGWHAVPEEQAVSSRASAPHAQPSADLATLKAKYLGSKIRSASRDQTAVDTTTKARVAKIVTLERNDGSGTGPKQLTVVVSDGSILAVQG